MAHKSLFIASTGQHVGKTTVSLGLISGLKKRLSKVGFIKPVGQQHVELSACTRVDKDVVLFKEHFHLTSDYKDMSPVLVPKGFTKDYLDNKVDVSALSQHIVEAHKKIASTHPLTLIEGTGHVGVGSILDLNNAKVAALLKSPMILVAQGGIGSSFDELSLNKALCDLHGVKLLGVILNKIRPDKSDLITSYMSKALKKWNVPLLGTIPFNDFLTTLTMQDFETLFNVPLLAGEHLRYKHFENVRLIASSADKFKSTIKNHHLFITHSSREDIILTVLMHNGLLHLSSKTNLECGFVLTGDKPPKKELVTKLKEARIPSLYVPLDSYEVMKKVSSFTSKFRIEDKEKLSRGIALAEEHIDFDQLLTLL